MGAIGEPKREIHIPVTAPAAPVPVTEPTTPATEPAEAPVSVPEPVGT
jgi:hypothetical protein